VAGRVKGFAPWKPQKRTEPLLRDIEAVLEEYRAYLPLTVRQVFYRLVGKGYPKTEKFCSSVGDICTRARRSGRIPFSSIRDDGVSRQGGESLTYESPEAFYRAHEQLYNYYTRSWHADQPLAVSVLCEAAGMVPMIEAAVEDYRIEVASSSGLDSLTVKHDLFRAALWREEVFGQATILLHLGDHDPSGWWMHKSMAEDLEAFCRDRDHDGLIELRRVALTPAQIQDHGIAPQPDAVRPTNSHSRAFLERGLEPAAQLEAIPPDRLTAIIRQAVESTLDLDVLRASQAQERLEHAQVQEKLDEVNEVLREVFGLDEEE
jgi:hypothetical protein